MSQQAPTDPNKFWIEIPTLSMSPSSFIEIGLYFLVAFLTYFLLRKFMMAVRTSGLFERGSIVYKTLNVASFAIPILIFVYGFMFASRESLFVSLLVFVVVSIVIGFSLVDPIRSLFSSIIISLKGEIRPGDNVHIGTIDGIIKGIGPFNVIIETQDGSKSYIPTQHFLRQSYEIHERQGGPSIYVTYPTAKISPEDFEKLAHLCPYKRPKSDVQVMQDGETLSLNLEVTHIDAKQSVLNYFNSFINGKDFRRR